MSHYPGLLLTRPSAVRWRILTILLAFSFLSWFNRVSMSVAYDERAAFIYQATLAGNTWASVARAQCHPTTGAGPLPYLLSVAESASTADERGKAQRGISETAIGYVYSGFLFIYMLCMTPGGWFADRRGAWLALVVMGLGSALFGALTGMVELAAVSAVTVFALLLVVRGLMGLCTAPIYPASGRILAHWLPAGQRAAANGAVMAAALVGISCTYVGFGTLLDWFDWPTAFAITGIITALVALLWLWYGRNRPEEHPAVNQAELQWIGDSSPPQEPSVDKESPWLSLLRNRSLVLLTICYAAIGYFEYLFYFWMHYYFDDVLKVGKNDSRLYSTILSLAMAAGMLLGGWLSDRLAQGRGHRFARTTVVVGGMLLGAVLLGVGVLVSAVGWIVVCFAMAMAAVGATEGPAWATAIQLGRRHGGTAAGIFNTGGNAGGVVAPIVTPLVSKYLGWQCGIALGGVVCLVGACLWWWIDPSEGEPEPKRVEGNGITLLPKHKIAEGTLPTDPSAG